MKIKKGIALISSLAIIVTSFAGCSAKSASARYKDIDFCNTVVDYDSNYDVIYNIASITEKEWAKQIDKTTCKKLYNDSLEETIPYYSAFRGSLYPLQEDKITFQVEDEFYDASIENNNWAYITKINEYGFNFDFVDTKFKFHPVSVEISPSPRNSTIKNKIDSGKYSNYTKYEENGWTYATIKNDNGTYGIEINRIFNDNYFLSIDILDDFTFSSENEAIIFAKQIQFILKITSSEKAIVSIDTSNMLAGIGIADKKNLKINLDKFTVTDTERTSFTLEDNTKVINNTILFSVNGNNMFLSEYMSDNYLNLLYELDDYEYNGITFKILYNTKDYKTGNFTIGIQTDKGFYNFGYTNTQKTNDYDELVKNIINTIITIE